MPGNDSGGEVLECRSHRAWIGARQPGSLLQLASGLSVLAFVATAVFTQLVQAQQTQPQQETIQGTPNEAVVTTLPNDVPSLEQRGDLYMVRKYYAEAVRVYRRLTELEPRNAVFRNKLGIAYHQMQDLGAARREYQRAVQINPQYAQAINNLASVEYARKRYRSAINTYIRALKLTPSDPVIYSNLGTAYFAQEEYEYATQSFRYALMLDPEIFRRSGRVGTIVQQRADQNPATFNFYMAKTYASTGNVEETLQYLIKAWEEGYPELRRTILEDETFKFLAIEPRFEQLMALMESTGSSPATTPISQ